MIENDSKAFRFFCLPMLLVLGLLILPPAIYTIILSFFSWGGAATIPPKFVGLGNIIRMGTDERLWFSFLRTFYYASAAVFLSLVSGFIIALLMQKRVIGQNVFRSLVMLPMVSTPVAVAVTWVIMYNPVHGVINWFLEVFHRPPLTWLSDKSTALPSIFIVDAWIGTSLVAIILMAAFKAIPKEPVEAAYIDGASSFHILRFITLPMLKPYIVTATTLRVIDSMKNFDLIYVMTGGGPGRATETMNLYTFLNGFFYFEFGYAALLAIVLFLVISILSVFLSKWRIKGWTY
jgi:multiple sugar transport system permease protein